MSLVEVLLFCLASPVRARLLLTVRAAISSARRVAFLPALRRSPHPRIVNVSSGTGSLTWSTEPNPQLATGSGGAAAYRSSKAALNALTVLFALTLDEHGVKVNALAPGRAPPTSTPGPPRAGDPAEAARGAVRLALLPDDGPTGAFLPADTPDYTVGELDARPHTPVHVRLGPRRWGWTAGAGPDISFFAGPW